MTHEEEVLRMASILAMNANVPTFIGLIALQHSKGNIDYAMSLLQNQQFVQIAWKEAREFDYIQ